MKRKLIKQMFNQWRSNIWMVVQLLIVSCVIFYIATTLYSQLYNYFKPLGYYTDQTYQITLAEIRENGVGYVPDITPERRTEDILTVLERIKSIDGVQDVAYSKWGGPYRANFWGMFFNSIVGTDTIQLYGNLKKVSPEYLRVFDLRSTDGTSQEQMIRNFENGSLLISKEAIVTKNVESALLKTRIYKNDYEDSEHRLGTIVESIKRFDFDNVSPVIYQPYPPQEISGMPEISVRLKPNANGDEFMAQVRDKATQYLSSGNIYVQDVQAYDTFKVQVNDKFNKDITKGMICIIFLLVNVFLGLFGVFWFRTRQRTAEIALRKSFGATAMSIYRRLVSEGLLLLIVSLPIVVLIDWLLVKNEFTGDFFLNSKGIAEVPERFCVPIALTLLIMAVMIIAGISIPAYRAMHIEPAEALKEE